jgi:hypothetical protein
MRLRLRFSTRLPIEAQEDGIMSEAMTDFRFSPGATDPSGESAGSREALAEMAEQIRRVDEAAAQAASRVGEAAGQLRGDAGTDFRSQLLADLGSSLVERVNDIHAECERLSRMLDRATKIAGRDGAPEPAATDLHAVPNVVEPSHPEASRNTETAAEPRPAPVHQPDRRRAPGHATPEGVRLAATQMAVAGSSRSEIERCLRIQFGVRDADAALDEIFGTRSSEVR